MDVLVGVGVKVGPNICPGAHDDMKKLAKNSPVIIFFMMMSAPLRNIEF